MDDCVAKYLQPDSRLLRLVLGPVSRPEIKRNRLFAHPQPALLACCYGGSFRRYAAYFVDFLTPILGTRILVTLSTGLLLIPLFCWVYAVQHPDTPYWMLICFALLSGIGGGTFSGLMASTNYFFPKHERGLALGIQGGLSDFGTGLVHLSRRLSSASPPLRS